MTMDSDAHNAFDTFIWDYQHGGANIELRKRRDSDFYFDLSSHQWRGLTVYWLTYNGRGRINLCWNGRRVVISSDFSIRGSDEALVEAKLMEII